VTRTIAGAGILSCPSQLWVRPASLVRLGSHEAARRFNYTAPLRKQEISMKKMPTSANASARNIAKRHRELSQLRTGWLKVIPPQSALMGTTHR